ncbi:hypothetical protein AVEN_25619-1 [Araneus ventricosus]|uniref:Uncharacterized protein n=1 Tax=Araneus ventricosus TaxID=182803 RepID=A0A4Y2BPT3_ARAVE|nr:hypothetical protein AVEN_25619-1 [Araneus ventricosus]
MDGGVLTAISGHSPAPPVGDKPHHRSGGNSTSQHPPMTHVHRLTHRVWSLRGWTGSPNSRQRPRQNPSRRRYAQSSVWR